MKPTIALVVVILTCSSALATEPFDDEKVSMLAMLVALKNACIKIDPAQEKQYTGFLEMLRKETDAEKRAQLDSAMKAKNFDPLVKEFEVNFEKMERTRLMEQCKGFPQPKE
jgi:hypothetical protein